MIMLLKLSNDSHPGVGLNDFTDYFHIKLKLKNEIMVKRINILVFFSTNFQKSGKSGVSYLGDI